MVRDDNRERIENESLIKLGDDQQNRSSLQSQTVQRSDLDKNIMETEVRDYFDFYRNSSEEIFLKTLMESTIGMPATTMEMFGFKNLSQSFRADSEELFNSWLMNGEVPGYSSTSIAHRTRQASRRISSELSSLSNQQHGVTFQRKDSNDKIFPQNISTVDELSSDPNQHSLRNAVEKGMQASNLYLAKAWFHSSQPMTRSRSSELRRRYAAMQSLQTPPSLEVTHNSSGRGVSRMKQDFVPTNNIHDVPISEMSNQLNTFMSPSNSSTSNFNSLPMASVDAVSSVVSMLKGALESKKFSNQIDEKAVEGNSCGFYDAHGTAINTSNDQGPGNHVVEPPATFQAVSSMQLKESGALQEVEGFIHFDIEGLVSTSNPVQMRAVSQEPSQSESSAAAPVLSTGFDICDGPTYSSPIPSTCETSRGKFGNRSSEHGFKAKELRERIYDNNLKDERKKGSLVRMESITSDGQVDKGDPSKKRRVERSRKMAEAKERNLTPAVPSDMQSILKRCENLEKEVRSLKLNLSFMNRKDSEQTKQIEELQKQNEELADEKERLLEEIERIISEPGNF